MHPKRIVADLAQVEEMIRHQQHRLDTEALNEDCRITLGVVLMAQRDRRDTLLSLLAWEQELAEVTS